MRVIKFRAWDGKLKMLSKPFSFGEILNFTNSEGLGAMMSLCSDHEIMQFTGLQDKNKNDIFEGDVVNVQVPLGGFWGDTPNKKVAVIIYSTERARFIAEWAPGRNQNYIDITCDLDLEIMGNIHEDPGLLKSS